MRSGRTVTAMTEEYIGREALQKELQEELNFESPMYTADQNKHINIGLKIALRAIRKAPAADVDEVKHGRWVDRFNGKYANPLYECSECNGLALYTIVTDSEGWIQALSNVCPHCRAKMDGGAHE